MKAYIRISLVATLGVLAACDSLTEVNNPNVVDASAVDAARDATTFSRSALQNFYDAVPDLAVYQAWFTNEARVGDTFPTRNEFGRRIVIDSNGTLNGEVWTPIARAVSFSQTVIELLGAAPDAEKSINLARAYFASGYSLIFMAETFCESVIKVGPALASAAALDTAIARLKKAITIATAAGGAEATALAGAAQVGIARAYLQKSDKAAAAAEAAKVAPTFSFDIAYVDDPSNRGRLGNTVYAFTSARESLVVGPEWRAIADAGDIRVSYADGKRPAQDGDLNFFYQTKFKGYGSSFRLASGLEARYIAAEARGDLAEMLTLINERRAVGKQGAFATTDVAVALKELMEQRARDFWLEGHRMADFRRQAANVPFILQPGPNYYKPALGAVGTQVCLPVTVAEKDNNPNFKP